jgi:hypothetical protein
VPSPDVTAVFEKIKGLSKGDRLRLAAGLLDQGAHKIAHLILERVEAELTAEALFGRPFQGTDELP